MIPAAFEYARAASVEEAVQLLGKYGEDGKVLAGGHSLIPLMRLRLSQPKALVDINRIKELDYITPQDGKLRIGALTRHVTIQNSADVKSKLPLLAEMADEVGDNQVRNLGTMGGVIAHADSAGDYPTLALMLDAEIVTDKLAYGAPQIFLELGGKTLIIRGHREGETPVPARPIQPFARFSSHNAWGTDHFGFLYHGDLRAFHDALRAKGVQFPVALKQGNGGHWLCYVSAPDGVSIELMEA